MNRLMIVGESIFYSLTRMKADFFPTVTRRQGCLTFAMKKRPTSGHVTYIWTLGNGVDVITLSLHDVMVLVVHIMIFCCSSPISINTSSDRLGTVRHGF